MNAAPMPASEFAEKVLGIELTPWQKSVIDSPLTRVGYWPDCLRCGQSMTGSYAGIARCNRCSSARRLNG